MRRIVLLVSILLAVLVVAVVAAVLLIDPDDYRDRIAQRASEQIGREVRLDGPIDLRVFPWLAFEIRDASVGNPPDFEPAPALAEIGLARAGIRLWPLIRGEVEIGAVDFENATFSLVTDRRGRSNLDGLFADPDVPAEREETDLSGLQTGAIGLKNVTLVRIDLARDERNEIEIESLDLAPFAPAREVAVALRGRITVAGEVLLEGLRLDGRLRVEPDLSRVMLSDWQARFALPGADADLRASGQALVNLQADAAVVELSALDLELRVPDLRIGLAVADAMTLRLSDPAALSLPSAELSLNGQALSLSGDLTLGEPIAGNIDLAGQRLDLRLLAALAGEPGEAAPAQQRPDFSVLHLFDLQLGLRLAELVLAEDIVLEQVEADSRLVDGRLTLDPMGAQVFGGRFQGMASVDFNTEPPSVRLEPRLTGVLIERLAEVFTDHAPVAGSGELELVLSFRGLTPGDILASLDGSGSFAVRDGAVRGIDLNRLVEQELTVASLGEVRRAFEGETPFRRLSGSLRAERGVIELPDLNLVAADFGARGSGRLLLADGQLDYRVELDLAEAILERLPDRLRSATGGRVPLAISGPIAAPVVSVDLAGIAERAVRDEVGRRLLDQLRRPREEPSPEADNDEHEEPDDDEAPDRARRDSARP